MDVRPSWDARLLLQSPEMVRLRWDRAILGGLYSRQAGYGRAYMRIEMLIVAISRHQGVIWGRDVSF